MTEDDSSVGHIRKLSLYSFIAFLAVSALFAIFTVVFGEFGEFEAKVLVSTLVVTLASVCSLCCSAYATRTGITWPGVAGIVLAVVSAVLVIVGIWTEMEADGYWKTTAILGLLAWAVAHALALLTVRLQRNHGWLQVASTVNILLIAGIPVGHDPGGDRRGRLVQDRCGARHSCRAGDAGHPDHGEVDPSIRGPFVGGGHAHPQET